MDNLLKFEDFINELWSKGVERNLSGEERIEDRLGTHSFTDGNGKFHKYGINAHKSNPLKIANEIVRVIEHAKDDVYDKVIDLNIIDMSDVESVYYLFGEVSAALKESGKDMGKMKFDTSGWVLEKCENFRMCCYNITSDIGIDGWKVNPKKVKLDAFNVSYYEGGDLPSWFEIDIKDWVRSCITVTGKMKNHKWGVDRERKKKTGKQCYWVEFHGNVEISFIPDTITIRSIDFSDEYSKSLNVYIQKLKSLKQLPSVIGSGKKDGDVDLFISLNNIEDDEIIIPEGVTYLRIQGSDDVTKLPKEINYGISIKNTNQLGHFEIVHGDFDCGNSMLKSLKGCPKHVDGDFDAHNARLVDLVGAPEYVGGRFTCSNQGTLKSLKGCPRYVGGGFDAYSTGITNIDDYPDEVVGKVSVQGCTHLENFVGLPEVMDNDLDIGYCDVQSLEGLPKEVNGWVTIKKLTKNKKEVTVEDILSVSPNLKNIRNDYYSTINLVK